MATAEDLSRELVEHLWASGCVKTPAVKEAFAAVPRHLFLPRLALEEVYRDQAILTKQLHGVPVSSSSQPAIMAEMLEQLDVQAGHSVLEVGAGTGYNAALLAHLAGPRGSVVSVEIDPELAARAREHLSEAGCGGVKVVTGDGGFGYPPRSPYDRIIVTAGAAGIPPAWREQLKMGGRLVLPLLLHGTVQVSAALVKRADRLEADSLVCCGFMPLRGAFADLPRSIRLPDGMNLLTDRPDEIDREQVAAWLREPGTASTLGIEAGRRELWDRFRPWLGLRDPEHTVLVLGETTEDYRTGVLLASGLALLDGDAVHAFGRSPEAAELLRRHLGDWHEAGRPGVEAVGLRAYPSGRAPRPSTGALLIDRPGTTLVISTTESVRRDA